MLQKIRAHYKEKWELPEEFADTAHKSRIAGLAWLDKQGI
jgi:hypothetical protein